MSSIITAIILAAGEGTRLRPLTSRTPKCLVPVGGIPIFQRQIEALQQYGIAEIVVVSGYKRELIIDYARRQFPDVPFIFIDNPHFRTTDTLYSLALASEAISEGRTVLQLNGDVVFENSIVGALLQKSCPESCIAAQLGSCDEESVKVLLGKENSVVALGKHIDSIQAAGEAIGINKFSWSFWQALAINLNTLRHSHPQKFFEYAIEETIRGGAKIFAFDIGNLKAVEVDCREDLANAGKIFP